MVKIFLSVRNRLAITKKCIQALTKHSTLPHQIHVFDNLTDYRLEEHFEFFYKLLANDFIHQLTFNTKASTFKAFSKAVACNQFGHNHLQDPKKHKYTFLLFLDNDIIVAPGWDSKIRSAWKHIIKNKLDHIQVVNQWPGGIMKRKPSKSIAGFEAEVGKLGGSGFWSIRPNFFDTVGFLDVGPLVGHNKKHDQNYWRKLDKVNHGKPYIVGLKTELAYHTGSLVGSICNRLTKGGEPRFEEADKKIDSMTFDKFWEWIVSQPKLKKW